MLQILQTHLQRVVILLAVASLPLIGQQAERDAYNPHLIEANNFYDAFEYGSALLEFKKALEYDPTLDDRHPNIRFKLAYCYYQEGDFERADKEFSRESAGLELINDYVFYFEQMTHLAKGDTGSVIGLLSTFRKSFPESPLVGKVDSTLAHLHFKRGSLTKAKTYFQRMLRFRAFDKGDVTARLLEIAQRVQDRSGIVTRSLKLLKDYPFHPKSEGAYAAILQRYGKRALPVSELNTVFRYLATTAQYQEIDRLLAAQQQMSGLTQQIRWLRIRKLYRENKYWEAFQACQNERSKFKSSRYKRHVDLHIARCYLRMGFTSKAIDAYDVFVTRYASDALAAEVMWVIAWLCEQQGEIDRAVSFYNRMLKRYPRYQFATEARFRIGLAYYRQGHYSKARQQWQTVLRTRLSDLWESRLTYWVAKSYDAENDYAQYLGKLEEISAEPFDSYYNMKAFLLTQQGSELHDFVDSLLWSAQHNQLTFLARYLDVLQRPLLVHELLGSNYARNEMNFLVQGLKNPEWELLFALAEANEQLENYGRAYRLYAQVYHRKFASKKLAEWVFLFKRLYPLYFNNEVTTYAGRRSMDPTSIWAVIKKESAFEPEIVSYADAYGLMQIIPPTAERLADELGIEIEDVRTLYDPQFNIKLGSYYLTQLLARYDGNIYHALAAYNAGEHRVDRWRKEVDYSDDDFFMENIEFEQTRGYVRGVMKYYWIYQLLIHPEALPDYLIPLPERLRKNQELFHAGIYE